MKLRISAALFVAWTVLADTAPKPIQLADILAWKRITQPVIANNGEWFAYRIGPAEGEAEVVVRNLKTGKEQRFPIGDPGASAPTPDTGAPPSPPIAAVAAAAGSLAISGDGRWTAFQTWPGTKEAKKLKKDRKPVQTKVVLVELDSGKKSEFDKVRRFAFNGDRSTALALHRYAPEVAGPPDKDKGAGTDLLLYGLADGAQMNVGNVSEFAFDKKGEWLAILIDAHEKAGNGVLLRNMASGAMLPLDSSSATYKGLTWTEKGTGLATLRGVEDKAFEDKLYSVVAFKNFGPTAPAKSVFDPKTDPTFPKGMQISPNRNAAWREDLAAVTFGIQAAKPKKSTPKDGAEGDAKVTVAAAGTPAAAESGDDRPDLVLWHWKDSRLQSQQQVQENIDKNFSFLSLWRPNDRKFLRLADSSVRQVNLPADSQVALGTDVREYELMGNLDGRRFEDVYVIDPSTGERKLALRKARWFRGASPDGSQLLFYENGAYSAYDTATGKSAEITKGIATSFIDSESDVNVDNPPTNSLGWSKDGRFVLLSDGWDLWKVPSTGGGAVNLTGNGKKDKIRYRTRFRLDPEEKGIDFSQPQYISAYGEWTKKGGIGMLEPGKPGVRMLLWGDERYTQLIKAKDAPVYLYTRENNSASPDYYSADAALTGGQRITDS
ncbi:MAG TPA: hypothetical protein VNV86_13915, partial [Candidatus Acidoferrum sp.]|nr:hypothetical protein [Candidatus Acidoferrum sp.]